MSVYICGNCGYMERGEYFSFFNYQITYENDDLIEKSCYIPYCPKCKNTNIWEVSGKPMNRRSF